MKSEVKGTATSNRLGNTGLDGLLEYDAMQLVVTNVSQEAAVSIFRVEQSLHHLSNLISQRPLIVLSNHVSLLLRNNLKPCIYFPSLCLFLSLHVCNSGHVNKQAIFVFLWCQSPTLALGHLFFEVSISHTGLDTHTHTAGRTPLGG